jgi:hypothetical protein
MRDLLITACVCVKQMFLHGRATGIIAMLLAVLAAALVAFCCHKSAWLWNTKYSQTLPGVFFCLLAGCTAFCCVLLYAGAGFIKESALEIIEGWNLVILADGSWHSAVFSSAKQSVKELRNNAGNPLENYSLQGPDGRKYDDPGSTYIPLSSEEAKEKAAYIYASETMHSFKLTHPVLGWLISADQENSAALILNDVQDYFSANRNMIYPLDQGFKLGVQEIVRELEQGTDRLIKIARGIILAVFALGEAICFGTIGIMAYRSLQINRNLITTK